MSSSLLKPAAAAAAALFVLYSVAPAQSGTPRARLALNVDVISRGPGLYGYEPEDVRWSGDSRRLYFKWKRASDPVEADPDIYVVAREGGAARKLTPEQAKLAPPVRADRTLDRARAVYTQDGDIYVYDYSKDQARRITHTADVESDPHFLRDGRRISFMRANNLYVLSLDSGTLAQMTDIRTAGAPAPAGEKKGTASQEFVKNEEKSLIDFVSREEAKKKGEEARRKRDNPRQPFILQGGQRVASLQLSPDEKYVIAGIRERGERARTTIVPNFVTESSYTEDLPSRTKVGDNQGHSKLAIIGANDGAVKWVDAGQKRAVRLMQPVWSVDGSKAVLLARAEDNKDRWVLALDPATGKTRTIFADHDDAWIGGPGMYSLGWLADGATIWFQSERTGWSHLYTVPFAGGQPRALTSGKWEVDRVELSRDRSRFYLITNENDPGEQQVYTLPVDGGERTRLTKQPGFHMFVLSPDERWFADVYSYTNRPPELYVQQNRPDAQPLKLTDSPAGDFWTYPWQDAPIIHIAARDGAQLPARIYKPANFKRGGPAVLFVHGAGYLQNVDRGWSYYAHEYMFHHLLMERGYIVLDVDYRGSAGYGRDWRTAIYRHMGGKDLDDEVDAARWLVAHEGVNPKRIGMYGGSYGGFLTLMAMFTQPGVFAAGAALRPVTDWAHYNNGYTSDILNLPQSDPEAYRRSSPIYFANGLSGALLICHGMVDTNVHFQDTVRLVQRLIELRKTGWDLAVYPVESHGFVEPTSWADEYRRILKLFETKLKG